MTLREFQQKRRKISCEKFKYGQYFLIDLTYSYQTPKEVMESRPQYDDAPEGQLNG